MKKERIKYWLSVGAKPSVTLHNLLVREGVIVGKKKPAHKKPKKKKQEGKEPPKTDKEAPENPQKETQKVTKEVAKETQKIESPKEENAAQGDNKA